MPPSQVHTLTCIRGGMQTHTHQACPPRVPPPGPFGSAGFPTRRKLTTPFKEQTAPGSGHLRVDVADGSGALFQDKDELKSSSPLFDVTVANPQGLTTPARSEEEATKAKRTKNQGPSWRHSSPLPAGPA